MKLRSNNALHSAPVSAGVSCSYEKSTPYRLLLLMASVLLGCGHYDHSVAVADVTKGQIIVLRSSGSDPVYAISIRGSGKIEGEAVVTLMLNGQPYKTETLSGPSGFKWGGDWYSDTAEILYRPKVVRSGALVIEYEFSRLKSSS